MRPLRITRAGILGSLLVLVVAAACVRLGIWQLHRLAERRARNAVIVARMLQPPVVLDAVRDDTTGLAYRTAQATGTFDDERTIILAARSLNGDPGVYVLTPLLLGGGGGGGAVLVNRGWVPSPDAATVDLARYGAGGAPATVRGILLSIPRETVPPRGGFRRVWYRLDPRALASQFPYRLEPLLLQLRPEVAGAARLPRPIPPPAIDEGPHFSYAVQWFSFATIALAGWIVLLLRRERAGGEGRAPEEPGE